MTSQPSAGGPDATANTRAAFWDKIAEGYSRKPVADPAAFDRKIALTKAQMNPEHVVLDVGCGTGSLALILAPFAKHVHGLDVSPEMVRIARSKAKHVANVTFHVGAFDDTLPAEAPFEPGSFDGICAYSLLHLLEDPAAALERILRLLKPGGFFVASTLCLADSWVPYGPLLRAMRWVGRAPFVNLLSHAEVLRTLERAGFVDVAAVDVGAKREVLFTIARKPNDAAAGMLGTPAG